MQNQPTPSLHDRWLAALRSGAYEQCYGAFRDGDEFCALGLLIEVGAHSGVAPGGLMREAYPDWPASKVRVLKDRIIGWNDHGRRSFSVIADRIEAYERKMGEQNAKPTEVAIAG